MRERGQQRLHRRVEVHPTLVSQQQQGSGRKGLGNRGAVHRRVGAEGPALLDVGETEAGGVLGAAAAQDHHRTLEAVLRDQALHQGVGAFGQRR